MRSSQGVSLTIHYHSEMEGKKYVWILSKPTQYELQISKQKKAA